MRAILLDATYEPLGIIGWKKAFRNIFELKDPFGNLLIESKATTLWTYPDKQIRSQTLAWDWPAIIILKKPSRRRKMKRQINPSTRSILIRDLYTCQYCTDKLSNKSGTKDHVIPESRGGKSTWDNLVACCKKCQEIKADKYLEDTNLKLARIPRAPTLAEKFRNGVRISSSFERKTWVVGLRKLGLDYLLDFEEEKQKEVKT